MGVLDVMMPKHMHDIDVIMHDVCNAYECLNA